MSEQPPDNQNQADPPPEKKKKGKAGRPKGIHTPWKKNQESCKIGEKDTHQKNMLKAVSELIDATRIKEELSTPEQLVKHEAEKERRTGDLTASEKTLMIAEIRTMMMMPLAPSEIMSTCSDKWGVSREYIDEVLAVVQDQCRNAVGFARFQFQELAQRVLRNLLKAAEKDGDKIEPRDQIKAIQEADRLFAIAVRPDDEKEHEARIAFQLQEAIEHMDYEELEELQTRIANGRLDDVFDGRVGDLSDAVLTPKTKKKRSSGVANRNRRG